MDTVDLLGLGCRAAVAAVLMVAATGKALDRPATRRHLQSVGLDRRSAALGSWALPAAEAAAAVGLVVVPRAAGAAAAALFSLFTVVLVLRRPEARSEGCGCFGALAPGAPRWSPLSRNVVLAAASVLASATAGTSPPSSAWWVAGAAVAAPLVAVALGGGRGRLAAARPRSRTATGERR